MRFEIELSLWNKFKISEKRNNYKAVYHGFDFVMGCTTAAQICAETYGHGGTMHANKEGMEMAIEQWGKIVLYIDPADNTDGSFTGLVWIDK